MAKNAKSVPYEAKLGATLLLFIVTALFFSMGVMAISNRNYELGFVFVVIGIMFILPLLSKTIFKLSDSYKLRTEDYELSNIKNEIESFKQAENWPNEAGYQADLYNFLKRSFPEAKLEERTGSSRPDITIKDIAIELKGPTTDEGINSLPVKCIKYSKYYRKIIFVLFSPKFSQSNFIEIKKGIEEAFPGRTIFIIKQNI